MNQIEIPYQELSPQTLKGIVEYWILKEGTDYGEQEFSLAEKVDSILGQLKTGKAKIIFHPEDGVCELVKNSR